MARTERLELRLDDELLTRLDKWIENSGSANSRSDAVRQLLSIGLDAVSGGSIRLTDGDKLNFMMLRDIMNHLKIKGETNSDLVAEVIYGGHYWAPMWEMNGLFHTHVDRREDVSLVVDTLGMWDFIEARIEKLAPDELERLKAANYGYLPQFAGFDGNYEPTLMSIARFMVEKMDRFSRFKNRDFNSHSPTADMYRRMAAAFQPIRAKLGMGRELSVDQIIELLKLDNQ
jgi:uncharacterized protein